MAANYMNARPLLMPGLQIPFPVGWRERLREKAKEQVERRGRISA